MDLIDKKFLFVVGKGGVGKTTASVALSLAAARTGKRVLLALCNAKDRVSHMLEVPPLTPQVANALPNIDVVNMEPSAALEEYGMMVLKVRALYKMIFENRFVSGFLHGTPGLDAWAMLGKAQHHALEVDDEGVERYDLVIVDAPATGHGLDLLRVPKVIVDVAPPGPLRREAERAWELFSDPKRCGVLLVALAEDMPTNETLELHQVVTSELRMPIAGLVINAVLRELFQNGDSHTLERLAQAFPDLDTPEHQVIRAGRARASLEEVQRECIGRLKRGIDGPVWQLPRLSTQDLRRAEAEALSLHLSGLDRADAR
ncbi:MAG: AAA family ATPase [Myxococcales bacterium]|nr:AAA family ATPase [Myxococcales bacterium]MDD9966350.1 AAA family ATPase [Myxococcales bacterium]